VLDLLSQMLWWNSASRCTACQSWSSTQAHRNPPNDLTSRLCFLSASLSPVQNGLPWFVPQYRHLLGNYVSWLSSLVGPQSAQCSLQLAFLNNAYMHMFHQPRCNEPQGRHRVQLLLRLPVLVFTKNSSTTSGAEKNQTTETYHERTRGFRYVLIMI